MVAALGVLALAAAASPAAALAEKSGPRVVYVHPTDEGSYEPEPAGPKPEIVRPHVYVEPRGLQPEFVEPPVGGTIPAPTPTGPSATPRSIQASRFEVINEATDHSAKGLRVDPTGCGLDCERQRYEWIGSVLASVGREGDETGRIVVALVAKMKEAREKIDSLQPGGGGSEPSFVDDLEDLRKISTEDVQKVLAPIIVTELISGLFGTAPACGVKKLPNGQPTCVQ